MKLAVEESKSIMVNEITSKESIKTLSNGVIIWLVMKPITYDWNQSFLTSNLILASITIIECITNPLNDNPRR